MLNAVSKGRHLGIFKPQEEKAKDARPARRYKGLPPKLLISQNGTCPNSGRHTGLLIKPAGPVRVKKAAHPSSVNWSVSSAAWAKY